MAYQNLMQYKCGECGNDKYNLYQQKDNSLDLFCECTKCKTISVVSPTLPKLEISFGENSTGRMAIF